LPTDPEIKLLELTRTRRRIRLEELAEQLHTKVEKLDDKMRDLVERRLISSDKGLVEMDAGQRMRLAERLIHDGCDPQKVSRFLEWQEFEEFAAESLEQNGFRTVKHLVFKGKVGRREIDLLAWNDTFLLAIDCKHWLRGLSPSRARKVAEAQAERADALAERSDILKKHDVSNVEKRLVMPVIFCLSDPRERMVDGIPIVAVSKLISFLYGVSPVDERLRMIPVRTPLGQSLLQ
jgi:Holliday junction resolvase-like predicted endonuclease